MKLLEPDQFPRLTESDCIHIQTELAMEIVQSSALPLSAINTVAGVDLAYWREGDVERAVCCIAVIDCNTRRVIETQHLPGTVCFPYIPGCLAFRELPLVIRTAAKLSLWPDVFIFDGNGILHPRRMGLATHASFYLNTPTIGVAKRYFKIEGARLSPPDRLAGSYSDITNNSEILGRALRTHTDVRPVFVSVGNRMDIDTATALSLGLTDRESHIPLPTRCADLETHRWREEYKNARMSGEK